MIPADLLDRLREKDPGLWERMRRMPIYVHRDSSLTVDLTKSDNTELVDAWLQHCLQEAIRARVGWGYQITAFGLPIIACVYNRRDYITARGESEAEALGWAYLAVIEGTCQSAAGLAG